MNRVEELKKKIEDLEHKKHINSMSDRWTSEERAYDAKITNMLLEAKAELRQLEGN